MKSKMTFSILAVMAISLTSSLHASCTRATMLGAWGFTGTGVIISPPNDIPVGAVGLVRFDLDANIAGSQDRSVGGGEARETITGTYSITGDCVLTITANVYDDSGVLQRTTILKGVVTSGGKKTRMIYETITLPGGTPLPAVLTLEGEKI
jgi:hypothetical protein